MDHSSTDEPLKELDWKNQGDASSLLGKFQDVIRCYDKVLEINPRYFERLNNKGNVLADHEKLDVAIKCYDKFSGINSGNADAWLDKGTVLYEERSAQRGYQQKGYKL
jgi:tetratricopeptide (TPR) repeat protein